MRYTALQHLGYMNMWQYSVSKLLFMELWPIWVVTALNQITEGEEGPQTIFIEFVAAVWDQTQISFILL